MSSLPLKARIYIAVVYLACVALVANAFKSASLSPLLLAYMAFFVAGICIADLYPIVLPFEGNAEITVSCALKAAVAILYGPHITVFVTLVGTLLAELLLRRAWYKALFNAAEMTLTFAAIGAIYELLYDGVRVPFHSVQNGIALLCIMAGYFVINTGLVTLVVSLTTGANLWRLWKGTFLEAWWSNLTIIPLGAATATLWQYSWWSVFALVLPMYIVRQSLQFIGEIQRQTRDALISMADAIDQRDPSTFQHSQRVAQIAEAIAIRMGLSPEDVETLRMAARLHDVGKIGMSNTLLYKPGKFDDEERAQFQAHPTLGANLVRSFRLFAEGQDLIRYHHERYDGTGYPSRLAGEEIPLGSRIMCVADSLDAMVSRRIYRDPLTLEQAKEELRRNRGTQFDPDIVDVALAMMEESPDALPLTAAVEAGAKA